MLEWWTLSLALGGDVDEQIGCSTELIDRIGMRPFDMNVTQ